MDGHLCLKVFKLFVFSMGSVSLLRKEGAIYDKVFVPVLALHKGCLNLAKLFLCLFYRAEGFQRFHSDKKDSCYWEIWKLLHLWTNRRFNFARDIRCILSNLRQNYIYFAKFVSFFLFFLVSFAYQADTNSQNMAK